MFSVSSSQSEKGSPDKRNIVKEKNRTTPPAVVRTKNTNAARWIGIGTHWRRQNYIWIFPIGGPKTDEFFESFDLTTTVRSLFSSFRLQPLRGVNFSAVKYGQTVTRVIELKNEGEFDFVYNIVDVLADDEQQKTEMQEAQATV